MNVYFCGMIGTGKTTIGLKLAEEFGLEFYDLDREMDSRLGYSFHRLVSEEGWLAFRELEYSICRSFSKKKNAIICLGGGTVRYDWNVDVLKETGPLVLLEASREVLVKRVSLADRPRVHKGLSLEEDIRIMWERSQGKYLAAADIVYRTDEKTIEEEVVELKRMILSRPKFKGLELSCNLREKEINDENSNFHR